MKISQDKKGRWCVDFTRKGHRIRRAVGQSKKQAEDAAAMLRADIVSETFGLGRPHKADDFKAFGDEFIESYAKPNKKSYDRDELSLKHLEKFFAGKSLQQIGPGDIERYKAKRKTEVSPATANRELACLKTVLNKAVEWGRLEVNPADKVKKFRESPAKERILSHGEAIRLVDISGQISGQIKPVLILALNTAMRKGEILGLRWIDIDFTKGLVFIGESKSGKSRTVPMNFTTFETLKGLERKGEFVFPNPGTKTHVKDIKTAFHSACREAKVEGIRFHDLRHTAASWMVEAGVDLVTVSKILGHSSIQMTMRYAHPTAENMRRAVEKLAQIQEESRHKVDTVELPKPVTDLKRYH